MADQRYDEEVKAHRSQSIDAEFRQSQNFDKAVLTLSSGALGLSIVFIRDLAPQPTSTASLLWAWILFGVAVACILIAMMCGQRSYRQERDLLAMDISGQPSAAETNRWVPATGVMNFLAVMAFLFGMVFLIYFVHRNFSTGEQTMSDQQDYGVPDDPFDGRASHGAPRRPVKPILPAIQPEKVDEVSPDEPSEEPTEADPDQTQDED